MIRRYFIQKALGLLSLGLLGSRGDRPLPLVRVKAVVASLRPQRLAKLRIWTLDSLAKSILPTQQALDRLVDQLRAWDGHSSVDIVWDDTVRVQQFDLDAPESLDVVLPADARLTLESIERDTEGRLTARLVLREPLVSLVCPKDLIP